MPPICCTLSRKCLHLICAKINLQSARFFGKVQILLGHNATFLRPLGTFFKALGKFFDTHSFARCGQTFQTLGVNEIQMTRAFCHQKHKQRNSKDFHCSPVEGGCDSMQQSSGLQLKGNCSSRQVPTLCPNRPRVFFQLCTPFPPNKFEQICNPVQPSKRVFCCLIFAALVPIGPKYGKNVADQLKFWFSNFCKLPDSFIFFRGQT